MHRLTLGAASAVVACSLVVSASTGPSEVASSGPGRVVNGPFIAAPRPPGAYATGVLPTVFSVNWSGYVQTSLAGLHLFTGVTDTVVVPTVTAGSTGTTYATDWVGIGGFFLDVGNKESSNLIQTGIQMAATTTNGQNTVTYDAWTETLPHAERALKLSVAAGDTVTLTVQETDKNRWVAEVTDVTTGRSASRSLHYRSTGLSAEAIHERPCFDIKQQCNDVSGLAELAQTSDVTFDPGSFNEASPGTPPVNQPLLTPVPEAQMFRVIMQANDKTTSIATPSVPDTGGDGFVVTDGSSPPNPPP